MTKPTVPLGTHVRVKETYPHTVDGDVNQPGGIRDMDMRGRTGTVAENYSPFSPYNYVEFDDGGDALFFDSELEII